MPRIQYPALTQPVDFSPETVMESKWHQPWSNPVKLPNIKAPSLVAYLAPYEFWEPFPRPPIPPPDYPYHIQWQDPVRLPNQRSPYLHASRAQFEARYPDVVPTPLGSWYPYYDDQTWKKKSVHPSSTQFEARYPDVVPTPLGSWYPTYDDFTRKKPGLRTAAQQFLAWNFHGPYPVIVVPLSWMPPLSEPVRFKRMHVSLQSVLAFVRVVPVNPPVGYNLPLYTQSTTTATTGGYPANYWKGRVPSV